MVFNHGRATELLCKTEINFHVEIATMISQFGQKSDDAEPKLMILALKPNAKHYHQH